MTFVCMDFLCVVRYLSMVLHQEEDFLAHGLCRQVVFVVKLDVEAQEKHIEQIPMLDAFHPFGDCGHMKICQRVSPILVYGGASLSHVGVWGSNLQVLIKRSLC